MSRPDSATPPGEMVSPAAGAPLAIAQSDSGLDVLMMMAALHGIPADAAQLRHEYGSQPFSVQTILLAAKRLGMSAKLVAQDPARLALAPLPAIAIDKEGRYFIAAAVDARDKEAPRVLIQRPGEPPRSEEHTSELQSQ